MPTADSGILRYDINDPEDAQVLVNTGLVWRGGPKTTQKVLLLITEGRVQRNPEKEPPNVRAYLDKVAPVEPLGQEPLGLPEELPVGPPVEPSVEPSVA